MSTAQRNLRTGQFAELPTPPGVNVPSALDLVGRMLGAAKLARCLPAGPHQLTEAGDGGRCVSPGADG